MVEKFTSLVEKSMKGDMEAFEELIARKQREILYITSRFCSPPDLEDYAQEALLLMFKNIKKLRDPSCFNDWMYSIIRNTCFYGNRRKNDRNKIVEITPIDVSGEFFANTLEEDREEFMPVEYVESKEKREEVLEAVNALPEAYRECLLLYYYEEMSYKEIARALDINTKSVSNYLFRAKQELKKQLDLAITNKQIFSIPTVSAIPVLTRIFQADAKTAIPQELCDKMIKQTAGRLTETAAASGITKAASGGTVISKTAVGIISAIAITGVTIGVVHQVQSDSPKARLEITGLRSQSAEILTNAQALADTAIKPIDSPADLIGEDYLKKLITYAKEGVKKDVWAQFIQDIEAKESLKTQTTKGDIYILYILKKQDKQLVMVTRDHPGNELLNVKYEFGKIQEKPDMNHFILMFTNQ